MIRPIGQSTKRLKVDKGIPMPESNMGHGRRNNHIALLMRSMEVGDSVLFQACLNTVHNYGHRYFGRGGYVCRKEEKGYRLWRRI